MTDQIELANQCHDEISLMSEEQRLALDPISRALLEYKRSYPDSVNKWPGTIMPNRIVALIAVKGMEAHDKEVWERE